MVGVNVKAFQNPPDKLLFKAQGKKCFYCDKPMTLRRATADHVIPKSAGGTLHLNKVWACKQCNGTKGSNMPEPSVLERVSALYASLGYPRFFGAHK